MQWISLFKHQQINQITVLREPDQSTVLRKHLHVLHVLRTYSTCSCPGQQDTTNYAALIPTLFKEAVFVDFKLIVNTRYIRSWLYSCSKYHHLCLYHMSGAFYQIIFAFSGLWEYCPTGLHKLWYPSIWDTSMWSKFGAHGENGDVFLFSNLGALWFSENLIIYSLHVCLREVKNNLFSSKHSYLRHFSWRF